MEQTSKTEIQRAIELALGTLIHGEYWKSLLRLIAFREGSLQEIATRFEVETKPARNHYKSVQAYYDAVIANQHQRQMHYRMITIHDKVLHIYQSPASRNLALQNFTGYLQTAFNLGHLDVFTLIAQDILSGKRARTIKLLEYNLTKPEVAELVNTLESFIFISNGLRIEGDDKFVESLRNLDRKMRRPKQET